MTDDLKLEWRKGYPTHPWDKEWFIAVLDNRDPVVLMALPEEYSYDFKTGDDTYYRKERIKKWMQFPDSEFIAPANTAPLEQMDDETLLRVIETAIFFESESHPEPDDFGGQATAVLKAIRPYLRHE